MKKYIITTLLISTALLFTACDGGDGRASSTSGNNAQTVVRTNTHDARADVSGRGIAHNDIHNVTDFLLAVSNASHSRLTAHLEITLDTLRSYYGRDNITKWIPQHLPSGSVFDGNGYTIRGLNNDALFSIIAAGSRVTNLGIIGGILANENGGTIIASYATGDSIGSGIRGGLVRLNNGIIRNSYALGNSISTGGALNVAGGLVGYNNDAGFIFHSYALGTASHGGLTGNSAGRARHSYGTNTTVGTLGAQRTIEQLRCPQRPGDPLCSPSTYTNWNNSIWDFGNENELPILRGFASCPRTAPNCKRYRAAGDDDNDSIPNLVDNCPIISNPHQYNNDTDGRGDACDTDDDNDGYPDINDNCPIISNPYQYNNDTDARGDACDTDDDNDGYPDINDNCPLIPNAQYQDASFSSCQNIANHEELTNALSGTDSANNYYRLTENITISATWMPATNFRGTLNGNNYTIHGLTTPLFNTITENATVTNLGIIGSTLANDNYGKISYAYATGNSICAGLRCNNGGLVGQNHGLISNSHATGNSRCTGTLCRSGGLVGRNHIGGNIIASYATGNSICTTRDCSSGGLVGLNRATINASYATGNSTCADGYCFAGGLVGRNLGVITASYATGDGRCPTNQFCRSGGLVGLNDNTINASYATGESNSGGPSGGLVSMNRGTITYSYATGESNGGYDRGDSGGLVGYNDRGTITHSYATGESNSRSLGYSGGLVGTNERGTIANSYATGNSICTSSNCYSGGLVGTNDRGTIANSYTTGNSICTSSNCNNGGLVGRNHHGTITNSYRVQTTGNTIGTAITLANLRAATSFSGWSSPPWDFGTISQLPTLQNMPLCPSRIPSDTSCRWSTPHSMTGTPTQDTDGDGTPDSTDNCLTIPNPNQANNYGSRLRGDACEDTDGDGRLDSADNCPTITNAQYQDQSYTTCQDITSATDLINHLTTNAAGYYHLTKSITINTTWTPITNFRGTFNGNNYAIHGLTTPLFDTINASATVANLGIIGSTLADENYGNISYAYATGHSSCTSSRCNNGGLVGQNHGNISHSYATGNSTCTGLLCRSGGLVGRNHNTGRITHSYATGTSICTTDDCSSGGLVGLNRNTIDASYAIGDSSCSAANCFIGGLVGRNLGAVTASYATGDHRCPSGNYCGSRSGGLIGQNDNTGRITWSYATGRTLAPYGGGLVGWNYGTIIASYRAQSSGNTFGNHRTFAQLRCPQSPSDSNCNPASYTGWSSSIWDFGTENDLPTIKGLPPCPRTAPNCKRYRAAGDDDNDGIPNLVDNCPIVSNPYQYNNDTDVYGDACDTFPRDATEHQDSDGDRIGDNRDTDDDNDGILDTYDTGTNCRTIPNAQDPDAPYCLDIRSATDLRNHLTGNDAGYYRLTTSVTISAPWTPIRNFRGTLGTLNGNNYTITFQATQPNPPLFDTISSTATVTNIGVLGSTLAYANHGTIRHSYATGSSSSYGISGGTYAGGLVAYNTGTITNSHATGDIGDVVAATASGGLVGGNVRGTISVSYATGDSSSNSNRHSYSGGLVGLNIWGTINASYATGNSSSNSSNNNYNAHSGGLVGEHTGTIANSYATGNSRSNSRLGTADSGGLVGYTSSGTIIASHATGNSHSNSESSSSYSGGLVGYNNWASITASYASGNSRSDAYDGYESTSGGLIGYNRVGTITASYATGNSRSHIHSGFGLGRYSGGLVGFNRFTVITDSHATGTSTGYHSGGLVGQNWGTVNHSYATGASTCEGTGATIDGSNRRCASGGLVGQNYGTVLRTYALGKSTCDPSNTWQTTNSRCSSGGLVGANDGTIRYAYALGEVVGFYSGGLVGLQGYDNGRSSRSSIGNLADAYALFSGSRTACTVKNNGGQCTVCIGGMCNVGGAVGRFHSGTIARVYSTRTPWCAGVGGCSGTGFVGGVQPRTPSLSAQNSYRTWGTGTSNLGDLPRTESQLRCPTAPNRCTPATYTNWSNTVWNFGTSSNLPTLKGLPACPSSRPNCRH